MLTDSRKLELRTHDITTRWQLDKLDFPDDAPTEKQMNKRMETVPPPIVRFYAKPITQVSSCTLFDGISRMIVDGLMERQVHAT